MTRCFAACFVVAFGCSGGGSRATPRPDDASRPAVRPAATAVLDAGAAAPPGTAPPYSVAALTDDGGVIGGGRIEVTVGWPTVPPALLAPRGNNACGVARPGAVSQHHMGGVRNAFVWLENIRKGRAAPPDTPAELVVVECALTPPALAVARLGGTFEVATADERPHVMTVTRVGRAAATPPPPHTIPLPLVGQRFSLSPSEPGILRVTLDDEADVAYVLVPSHPYHAVTGRRGKAQFSDVPAGRYGVVVWHPPIQAGRPPLVARGAVTVTAGQAVSVSISIAP